MLHIKSLPSVVDHMSTMLSFSDYSYVYMTGPNMILRSIHGLIAESRDIPGPGSFIRDIGRFDRFGNNEVEHVRWDGTINPRFSVDGRQLTLPGPKDGTVVHMIPPLWSGTSLSNSFLVLNNGPLWLSRDLPNQSRYDVFVTNVQGTSISSGRPVSAILGINLEVNISRSIYIGTLGGNWQTMAPITYGLLTVEERRWRAEYGMVSRLDREQWIRDNFPTLCSFCHSLVERARSEVVVWLSTQSGSGDRVRGRITYNCDLTALTRKLWEFYPKLLTAHVWTKQDLSLHARDAIESINDFDGNALAYFSDIADFGSSLKSVLHVLGDQSPKAWASAWLSGRYGDRLSVSDTKSILIALRRALLHRQLYTRGRRTMEVSGTRSSPLGSISYVHRRVSTLYVAPQSYSGLMTTIENLMRWDAWPTLENVWDMVPLSFVVDWFLPVQDLLRQIDAAVEAPYFNCMSQYFSDKLSAEVSLDDVDMSGVVRLTRYARKPHNVCSDVRPFDVAPTLPSFSVVNAGDALALTVSSI